MGTGCVLLHFTFHVKKTWKNLTLVNLVKVQLLTIIMQSQYYALQLDETTNVAGLAQLLTYVRYLKKYILRRTFFSVCIFQSKQPARHCLKFWMNIRDAGMLWDKCFVGICTDGVRSMTGRLSFLVTRVQNLAPLAKWTHCMINREYRQF